jgi:hypothetical protein
MRQHFVLGFGCCLLGLAVQAQTADSGVLVSVREGGDYRAYWIVHTPPGAEIAMTLPGIIVPHGSGFWRVGVTTVCEFDGASNGDRQVVWESPADKMPIVHQRTHCVKRKDVKTCGDTRAILWFVSPSLVSEQYSVGQTEECEPRGGRFTTVGQVHKFGQTEPLEISALVADAAEEYWRALQEGFAELQHDGMNCPPPAREEMNLTSWSVSHDNGAWYPQTNYSIGAVECDIVHRLGVQMPHTATVDADSRNFLLKARQQMPTLRDLFASPTGAWAVAVLEQTNIQSLAAFEIKENRLGRKLLDLKSNLPAGVNNIVSAQWAVGAHVADWTKMLAAVNESGEPKPKVIVDPERK